MQETSQAPTRERRPRRSQRVELAVPVYCRQLSGIGPAFWGESVDVSLGGLCLRTERPLFRPSLLRVSFRLPYSVHRLQLSAEVTNVRSDEQGYLAGLRFLDVAREAHVELCRFVLQKLHGV
jgi:c-di-GMP-binding flagellar brake protein YcgR